MKSDINITPLIDVLLVLLIIFMLVAPVAPRGLDASMPEPTGEPSSTSLVVEVHADGFSLNSTPVFTPRDLDERLRAAFDTRSDRTLFVKAADDVPYRRVIEALDVAYGAGATRVGMLDPADRPSHHNPTADGSSVDPTPASGPRVR